MMYNLYNTKVYKHDVQFVNAKALIMNQNSVKCSIKIFTISHAF